MPSRPFHERITFQTLQNVLSDFLAKAGCFSSLANNDIFFVDHTKCNFTSSPFIQFGFLMHFIRCAVFVASVYVVYELYECIYGICRSRLKNKN